MAINRIMSFNKEEIERMSSRTGKYDEFILEFIESGEYALGEECDSNNEAVKKASAWRSAVDRMGLKDKVKAIKAVSGTTPYAILVRIDDEEVEE